MCLESLDSRCTRLDFDHRNHVQKIWRTYLQSKQDDRCDGWQDNGCCSGEALHDVICVLHHHRRVQATHAGQNWRCKQQSGLPHGRGGTSSRKYALIEDTHTRRSTPRRCTRRRSLSPWPCRHHSRKHQSGWPGSQRGTSGCFSPTEMCLSSLTPSQSTHLDQRQSGILAQHVKVA